MPPPRRDDFDMAEKAVRAGLLSFEVVYRAVRAFEGSAPPGPRFGPHLVNVGLLTVEQLYDLLTRTWPALLAPVPPPPPPRNPEPEPDPTSSEFELSLDPATLEPTSLPAPASPAASFPEEAPDQPAALAPGLILGGFRLARELGRGGTATVFLAEHVVNGQPAAVKVRHGVNTVQAVRRFLREASILQTLDHPNVVRVYNVGQEAGHVFLAMQYVPGSSAAALLRENGPLPVARVVRIAREISQALVYTHRHRLIHRDIKPGNILLDEGGTALLADFGLAKSSFDEEMSVLTDLGDVGGTVAYIAPEQVLNFKRADIRSDLFSLGATLYQLLTGRHWLKADNPSQMLMLVVSMSAAPSARAVRPDVPLELDDLIRRLMAPRVEDRVQTPADCLEALGRLDTPSGPASRVTAAPFGSAFVADTPPADEVVVTLPVTRAEHLFPTEEPPRTLAPGDFSPPALPAPVDEAAEAAARWRDLRETDADAAEALCAELPDEVWQAPALAAAREWVARRRADRFVRRAADASREGRAGDAAALLEQALALAPDHAEAQDLLRAVRAAPALDLNLLKARARAGQSQGVPALEQMLTRNVPADVLHDFLARQPECSQYRDPHNLQEFLLEGDDARSRALRELFGLADLRRLVREATGAEPGSADKEQLIERILEGVGFRRLPRPEGLDSYQREVAAASRGLDRERNAERLLGIGTRAFFIAERVLKDLVHFYGHWLHGPDYVGHLQRRGWVGPHARSVQKLSFGGLNQSFLGLAGEAPGHPDFARYFPERRDLVPGRLGQTLRGLEPQRNRVFSHDSPDSRALSAQDLRKATLEVRDALAAFLDHLRSAGVFPRKLVRDRTVEDRHGQKSYVCLCDGHEEVEVITTAAVEPRQVYLCLSATNPKYVDPVLIPELPPG